MCGLVGFNGPKDKKFNLDKVKLLLMMNQQRGEDSFGFYTPEIGVVKDTGKIELEMSRPSFNLPISNTLIGHVRKSTVGATNKKNAHPFNYGNIVLAMNGTLSNCWDLLREYNFDLKDFDVDSQILTAMLNVDQSSIPFTKIIGGCAVIYTDTNNGKVYVYRNNERPLYRGNLDGGMYFSSIESSLKIIGCADVKEFKEDILYEIIDGKIEGYYKIKKAEEPKKENSVINVGDQLKLKLSFVNMKPAEFVDMYLTPHSTTNFPNGQLFLFGHSYKVLAYTGKNDYDLVVEDHNGARRVCSKFMFKEEIPIICEGDHAFVTDNIFYTKGKNKDKEFASAGTLVKILKVVKGGYSCQNVLSLETADLATEFIRGALPKEIERFNKFYFLEEPPVQDSSALSSNDLFLQEINKPITPVVLDGPVRYREEEVYEKQVKNTVITSYDQLADFTIDGITDLINDIEETKLSVVATIKLRNIKSLLENWEDKNIELFKKSCNA